MQFIVSVCMHLHNQKSKSKFAKESAPLQKIKNNINIKYDTSFLNRSSIFVLTDLILMFNLFLTKSHDQTMLAAK